jgi:excisionase family DNA binding protein
LLLSVDETARQIGVGRTTVLQLISGGDLETVVIGRRRLVPSEALNDYVRRLRTAATG